MRKIAFVVQRYGMEVNGGSEEYCRQLAEHLAAEDEVDVYTTCALDYNSWTNHYPPGEEQLCGVRIYRFPVERTRNTEVFNALSAQMLADPGHSDDLEEKWIDAQGPYAPAVLEALEKRRGEYAAIVFMTYLYWLAARGILQNGEKTILIPTLHDEPWVYVRYYDREFRAASAFAWLTPEERAFGLKRFPSVREKPETLIGAGVEYPGETLPSLPDELKGARYLVYAGRIDESKGCKELFSFFQRFRRKREEEWKLVLLGKPVMEIPDDPDILSLGFVSEEMKYAVMREAFALVLCSRFESLSIVVLESMMMGRPVLVTGHSEVLKGHCRRSNAGLWFDNYAEFAGAMDYLREHSDVYEQMRKNGRRYVEDNYRWEGITGRFRMLVDQVNQHI